MIDNQINRRALEQFKLRDGGDRLYYEYASRECSRVSGKTPAPNKLLEPPPFKIIGVTPNKPPPLKILV